MRLAIAVFSILFLLDGYVYAIDKNDPRCNGAVILGETGYYPDYNYHYSDNNPFHGITYGDNVVVCHVEPILQDRSGSTPENPELYLGLESLGDGDQTYYGSDVAELVISGRGSDRLYGRGGDDTLIGDDGYTNKGKIDYLYGGAGDDSLMGAAGSNYLYGGEGDDHLYGLFKKRDWLTGGAGEDTFYLRPGCDESKPQDVAYPATCEIKPPVITDFSIDEDMIWLKTNDYESELSARKGRLLFKGNVVAVIKKDGKRSQKLARKIISERKIFHEE